MGLHNGKIKENKWSSKSPKIYMISFVRCIQNIIELKNDKLINERMNIKNKWWIWRMNGEYEGWMINMKAEWWIWRMNDEYEEWIWRRNDEYEEWIMNMKD